MKFEQIRDWLARKAHIEDSCVAAGGVSLDELRHDAEARTVTPAVLADVPTELGRVVRYVREQRGWSRSEIADLADVDLKDVVQIETVVGYSPGPRTLTHLADACGFSRQRFQQLAMHVVPREQSIAGTVQLAFAARSKGLSSISPSDFESIRALVEVLQEKSQKEP